MSSPSSSHLRGKPSDVSELYPDSITMSPTRRQAESDIAAQTSSLSLEVPSSFDSGSKIKKSKLPSFLGRPKKKSNPSSPSGALPSLSGNDFHSLDPYADSNGGNTSRRPNTSSSSRSAGMTGVPRVKISSPSSFGSKFAAHFSSSKSRRPVTAVENTQPEMVPKLELQHAGTLSPLSSGPRPTSFESSSSVGSQIRAMTPRPNKLTIRTSTLGDFEENRSLSSAVSTKSSGTGVNQPRTSSSPRDENFTPRSGTPVDLNDYVNTTSFASTLRTSNEREILCKPGPKLEHLVGRGKTSVPDTPRKNSFGTPSTNTSPNVGVLRSRSSDASSSIRSRIRTPSGIVERRIRPPAIPLPPPPSISPPTTILPQIPLKFPSEDDSGQPNRTQPIRQRAITIANSPSPPLSPTSATSTPLSPLQNIEALPDLNMETATREQLVEAIKSRNKQYSDLANYLLKITTIHFNQKTAFEKKLISMAKEIKRRDDEIKGLKFLISERNLGDVSAELTSALESEGDQILNKHRNLGSNRIARSVLSTDDSGNESHPTSGAESIRGSGASGSEAMSSMFRGRRLKRPTGLMLDGNSGLYRAPSKRSSNMAAISSLSPDMPLPELPNKRSSVSSLSPSPSSSTSSLLPPSPSMTVSTSSLSAIPETPRSSSLRPPKDLQGKIDPDDLRRSRTSNRLSGSSMASSSTNASSLYTANLKRSRPPSIAQVLEKSPIMEDVMEKLRPFAGNHSST